MALAVTHATVVATPDDGTSDVGSDEWNEAHTLTGQVSPAQGGTGVANNAASTITISGAFALTATLTATTGVTLPTSGTLVSSASNLSVFAATTSAQLAGVISDETGSGALVFATSPTLTTPVLGVASATSINKVAITAPATSATLTIADGKTLTASNTLTFTGTDASSVAFGTGGTVAYTGGTLAQFAATTSAQLAGIISDETGTGALVFANTPTLVTPVLGVASATSITVGDTGLVVGASAPFSDSAGTLTLQNVDALDATTESTIEAAIDTLANLTSIQGRTVTLADAGFDVLAGWDDSGSAYKNFLLADITAEAAPASGDFFLMYGAEGDLRKVDVDDMPGGGGVPTAITVADEASDTTCFPLFATAATGDLGPKSNAGLTFNSSTGALGATTLLLAQGTITDVATNISSTVTWNDAADTFTAWKLDVTNTNSNVASKLIDLQVGSVTQFNVTRAGVLTTKGNITFGANQVTWANSGSSITTTATIDSTAGTGFTFYPSAAVGVQISSAVQLGTDAPVSWGATGSGTQDVKLFRDAAATLARRNGTTAQIDRLYDTYTSSTDYHRLAVATARATLASVNGATVTATGLIPDGAVVVGVTTKVTVTISGGTTTGFQVGTGGDPDRWGEAVALTAGTSLDNTNWTAGTIEAFTAATDVIVTAVGGNFTGTGTIYLSVQYLIGQCD
jgi:hypothetical protein